MSASKKRKERSSFQLSPQALERLDELAEQLGVSRAEVLRRALGIYDWITLQLQEDKEIFARGEDGREKDLGWSQSGQFPPKRLGQNKESAA